MSASAARSLGSRCGKPIGLSPSSAASTAGGSVAQGSPPPASSAAAWSGTGTWVSPVDGASRASRRLCGSSPTVLSKTAANTASNAARSACRRTSVVRAVQ